MKSLALSVLSLLALQTLPVQAQIAPANDGTNTTVSNTLNITGGTLSGSNLFHSFQTFGVDPGQTATFQSTPAIQNILGRVIGGNPSVINGAIQVIGGNSNLYLINPAGIIFGQGASLNVTGAFTATTANAIGFGEGKWFNAVGTNDYSALVGNPGDFAFTSQPGSLFNSANLTQKEGQSITLVGGTVVSTGTIAAPGGKITIATVPGGQLVRISDSGSVLSLDLPIANQQQINVLPFTPLSLPALLAGRPSNEAAGVTVENGVVKLIGSGQAIGSGDITTKDVDTSTTEVSGGNISLFAQSNLSTGAIKTLSRFTDPAFPPTITARGGTVNLTTQTGDIIVESINTSTANFGRGGRGGDLNVKAAGLFRATGLTEEQVVLNGEVRDQNGNLITTTQGVSIYTAGNRNGDLGDAAETFSDTIGGGRINIIHSGTSFVAGGQAQIDPNFPSAISVILTQPFSFPDNASGTVGAIISRNSNGNYRVVFQDGAFKSFPDNLSSGFSITTVPRPNRPDPNRPDPNRSDPQTIQRQFTRSTGEQCSTDSSTIASNNPALQRGTPTSTIPCPSPSTEGNVLQVVDRR
ncbi:MAG TPA: filamentous hemagglutinin N-terminal domain-containing protein [Leptolyngbya sp.]|nr:filamentous hemagglutinin N-terminal domain-containing protein [Leptolyngbya sp.]